MAKARLRSLDDILSAQSTFYDAINHAEPMITTVIVTSYLDHLLSALVEKLTIGGSTISAMLNPISGVLGTFAAKANLAYCLGALSIATKNNLDLIGQIRNRFSHHFGHLTFDESDTADLCSRLTLPEIAQYVAVEIDPKEGRDRFERELLVPERRFKLASVMTAISVESAARRAKRPTVGSDG